jgi:hypothetical protein
VSGKADPLNACQEPLAKAFAREASGRRRADEKMGRPTDGAFDGQSGATIWARAILTDRYL